MMKNYLFIFLLLIVQSGFSQEIKEKSLLWEISGNGLEKPSYLFGTIHIACQGEVLMFPELQSAFDQTDQLLLELDMDDPNMMGKMMEASLSKDGKKVSEKLDADLSAKVDSLLQARMGIGLLMVDNLNLPTLSMQLGLLALKCPMDLGYDMMLLGEAKNAKKEIKGLESMDKQIELLLSQPETESIQAISYLINNFSEAENELAEMIEFYRANDVQGLYDFTKSSFEDPKYPQGKLEEFLDERNQNWIPVIEKEIQSTPSLIAVGAAHLAGEKGVINLLKSKGYKLKAVQK